MPPLSGAGGPPAVQPPRIAGVSPASAVTDPLSYKFVTLWGSNYVIETTDSLTNDVWGAFDSFSGDGVMKNFTLPNTHTSLFVRVRLLP